MSSVPPLTTIVTVKSKPSSRGYIAQYDLAFQISPIILQGGVAAKEQGGLAPISKYTPSGSSEPFARYMPVPGSTLISQSIGMYPFANQSVAANATIQQPLTISLVMMCPVNEEGGYLKKLSVLSGLQKTLQQHNAGGGMYIVATPATMYYSLLMTSMTDVTPEDSKQKQIEYQLDFIQPLITQAQAATALNAAMAKISGGTKVTGPLTWSGQQSVSPATLTGVDAAMGNITAALGSFGGSI